MTIQEMIQERRTKTESKDEIDFLAGLKAQADADEAAFKQLQKEKGDILKNYKELSLHTSFPKKEKEPIEQERKSAKAFDEILNGAMSKLK